MKLLSNYVCLLPCESEVLQADWGLPYLKSKAYCLWMINRLIKGKVCRLSGCQFIPDWLWTFVLGVRLCQILHVNCLKQQQLRIGLQQANEEKAQKVISRGLFNSRRADETLIPKHIESTLTDSTSQETKWNQLSYTDRSIDTYTEKKPIYKDHLAKSYFAVVRRLCIMLP